MKTYATVDDWLADLEAWRDEAAALRRIVLAAGLEETVKWGQPCYTDAGRNIAIVSWRKGSAILSFFKGALLDDPEGRLVQPGAARAGRYLPFTTVAAIEAAEPRIRALLAQAVAVERAGLRLPPRPDTIAFIPELQERLDADPAFREAFEALTPGRQRTYDHHFGRAKQSATRVARIEAATERILAGKGLRDCVCGRSQRLPRCDGSHARPG